MRATTSSLRSRRSATRSTNFRRRHSSTAKARSKPSQLEFSREFLTQKELDPDFVAFNSENRRYHFPKRLYLPFLGVFGQVDPLSRRTWRMNRGVYVYTSGNPVTYADPKGTARCCVKSFPPIALQGIKITNEHKFIRDNSGFNSIKIFVGQSATQGFDINAEFEDSWDLSYPYAGMPCITTGELTRDCACYCCHYRQYVRGWATADGVKLPPATIGWGAEMSESVFREDGYPQPNWNIRAQGYPNNIFMLGHRELEGYFNDVYYRYSRKRGCKYYGFDSPSFDRCPPGSHCVLHLEFKGAIISGTGCESENSEVATQYWTVDLDFEVPEHP